MVAWNKLKVRKWHKWCGLVIAIPLLLLCVSGVILNHRPLFSDVDISRGLLPDDYRFKNWNNGLMKGTCQLDSTTILIYGKAGVWSYDSRTQEVEDFNEGFPEGVDNRSINRIIKTDDHTLYAAAQFSLYKCKRGEAWEKVFAPSDETRLTDISVKGDSIVLSSRSHLYVYDFRTNEAKEIRLQLPENQKPSLSWFRIIWMLHSGEMFGMVGKLVVDLMAIVLVFLILSGWVIWLWPKRMKQAKKRGEANGIQKLLAQRKWNGLWHDKVGRVTIVLTLFVAVTGWFLRPPLLVLIANGKIELSAGDENPWEDKLRAIQYDYQMEDWLLYTSDGFYTLQSLEDRPVLTESQPPVGVMGINVLCRECPPKEYSEQERWEQQVWIVGSFSGLYAWHRPSGQIYDMINGITLPPRTQAMPFGNVKVSGYSNDLFPSILCSYDAGIMLGDDAALNPVLQPLEMEVLPMSLWNLALEVHTGRIFTFLGVFSTLLYIFVVGAVVVIVLLTGWLLKRKKKTSE